MNTDLETRLREQTGTPGLDRPVDDIFRRGDRLRRRRAGAVVGAGAAAAVAVLAGSVALPPGSSPVVTSAVASWSGGTTNLSGDELRAVSDACLAGQSAIPEGTLPLAAESRDGTVLAYFRGAGTQATCVADQSADATQMVSRWEHAYAPLPQGTDLGDDVRFGYSDPGDEGGPVTGLWTADEVSGRVARVSAEIGGSTYDGTVVDETSLFWLADGFNADQVDDAVFTAYDAQGHVLARVDPAVLDRGPQGPFGLTASNAVR